MFLKGKFDEEKFNGYEARCTREYQEVMEALDELEKSLTIQRTSRTDEERLHAIQSFKDAWNVENIDPSELNRLAKAVIDRIEYVREGGNFQLDISFR